MKREYYTGNRECLYKQMKENSLLILFSGVELRKTNDEYYPFYTDRNFVYLTGIDAKQAVLLACKEAEGKVKERLYILPPDLLAERWNGERIKEKHAAENLNPNVMLPIGGDRNTIMLPTYEKIDHKDIMRFYVRECVEDKGIWRQLFDVLRRGDYMDAYLDKLHELDLYEDFVDVCGDIYIQIFDEWTKKNDLSFDMN